MDEAGSKKVHTFYVVLFFAALVVGIGGVFAWFGRQWYAELAGTTGPSVVTQLSTAQQELLVTANARGLGSEIFDQATNPIKGKLPDAAPAVTNPVDSLYKNPFE